MTTIRDEETTDYFGIEERKAQNEVLMTIAKAAGNHTLGALYRDTRDALRAYLPTVTNPEAVPWVTDLYDEISHGADEWNDAGDFGHFSDFNTFSIQALSRLFTAMMLTRDAQEI